MSLLGWLSNPIASALGAVGTGLIKVFGKSVLGPILKGLENGQNTQRDVAVQGSSRPRSQRTKRRPPSPPPSRD